MLCNPNPRAQILLMILSPPTFSFARFERQSPMRSVAKAFDRVVEREVASSRSDIVEEARRAWAANPEWAEVERRVALDDEDDLEGGRVGSRQRFMKDVGDQIHRLEGKMDAERALRRSKASRAIKAGGSRSTRSRAAKRLAQHSLGKSPNVYDHTWADIDEMWLKRNREKEAVHFYPGYPDEITKSEFNRRNRLRDVQWEPERNAWGSPRAECLCHDWRGPREKKSLRPKSSPPSKGHMPHPNDRSRRKANPAHAAPSVGWAAAPDDETVRHWDEPVSVQEATAYNYTPQPLYRHDEGTPPRRGPSSDRGSSMAPSTTTELLEQFTDSMDEAVERTMVGFYRSLSPSMALNDAMA